MMAPGAYVQNMLSVGRDLVARYQHQATVVPVADVAGQIGLVVLGQGQKAVAEQGVALGELIGLVLGAGMVVQVAAQPYAVHQVLVGMVDKVGHG